MVPGFAPPAKNSAGAPGTTSAGPFPYHQLDDSISMVSHRGETIDKNRKDWGAKIVRTSPSSINHRGRVATMHVARRREGRGVFLCLHTFVYLWQ